MGDSQAAMFKLSLPVQPENRDVKPLLWLGRISYPLYLTHAVIGYILIGKLRAAGLPVEAATLVTIAVSLALADGFTRWWDEPVRAWLVARTRPRPVQLLA